MIKSDLCSASRFKVINMIKSDLHSYSIIKTCASPNHTNNTYPLNSFHKIQSLFIPLCIYTSKHKKKAHQLLPCMIKHVHLRPISRSQLRNYVHLSGVQSTDGKNLILHIRIWHPRERSQLLCPCLPSQQPEKASGNSGFLSSNSILSILEHCSVQTQEVQCILCQQLILGKEEGWGWGWG